MIGRILALALAAALAACGGPAEDWPAPSPALWEVSGPDGETGWLFGTIHALPKGVEWRTARVDSALGRADVLVVEVANLGEDGSGPRAFAAVSTSAGLPPLLQRVPAGDRPVIAEAIEQAGMDEDDFATTETWAAALVIANRTTSGDSVNGVDRALLERGLPVVGLEGFERQFAIFDRLAEADQVELLRLTVLDAAKGDRAAQRAWLAGDLEVLGREALEGILADAELRQALVSGRNEAWAARIVELLEAGRRPFVAVGTGHMIGDKGLPALLAARGFAVIRVQ